MAGEKPVFAVELMPAQQGDAIWIEYGDRRAPSRVLIDGGTPPTAALLRKRIEALPPDGRHFELAVITHIDTDHIGGMLKLLAARPAGMTIGDVWFNARRHLPGARPSDALGPVDGEILDRILRQRELPWNLAFGGKAVQVPDTGPLPSHHLPGGLKLTVLSPSTNELEKLRKEWLKVLREEGLDGADLDAGLVRAMRQKGVTPTGALGDGQASIDDEATSSFQGDTAVANGSSIALLAEYDGRRCLLTGDAFAPVLESTIRRLLSERQTTRLDLDAFKVAHHGSKKNTSNALLAVLRARRYLISTDGSIFHHPDRKAIARLIVNGSRSPEFHFNYSTPETVPWKAPALRGRGYTTFYPDATANGFLRVEL